MSINHVQQVKEWFSRTESTLEKGFYAKYPLNEFWKKHNTPQMLNILRNAESDTQALELIQNTYFFVVKLTGAAAQKSLEWQWNRLERDDPKLLADIERVGESPLVPNSLTLPHRGKRYSVDIVRVATVAQHVLNACNLQAKSSPVFFELGAGLGHLSRFILNLMPQTKYIISDLPISLCFSYLFMKHNFPDKRICLLEADAHLTPQLLEQYDIVFAPPSILHKTDNIAVDAFINTCSLGEMENSVSAQWFDYIQNTLNPQYVYSLNRFLNHIDDSADYQWRTQENAHLSGISASWDVIQFSLEDERFFSPYLACIHPRYLELILKRKDTNTALATPDMEALAENITAHASVDLYAQHGWAVNYYGGKLNNDLSIHSDLFAYWNAARLNPCALSYLLLLTYLDRMNRHCRMPFEESKFLEHKLATLAATLDKKARNALEMYLQKRAATYSSKDSISVVTRNEPGELAAVIAGLSRENAGVQASRSVFSFAKQLFKRSAKC